MIEQIKNIYALGALIPNYKAVLNKVNEIIQAFSSTLNLTNITLSKGAVTQLTSISTGVTINNSAGVITTVSSTLAAGATSEAFTVTNSTVVSGSTIILTTSYANGKTGNPLAILDGSPSNGSFKIKLCNATTTNPLNDVVKIHFVVL